MADENLQERIRAVLGDLPHQKDLGRDGLVTLRVESERVHSVLEALRDGAGFTSLTFVTGVDRFPASPRFEVHWQLLSIPSAERVRVSVPVPEEDPRVPTCTDLWPGAGYMERECFDMFGIHFEGHPDLRRLLMPEGYGHHPLRKDFPHQGIEPDRLYREWDRKRREQWESALRSEDQG